jgi:hypothetical protein
MNLGADKGDRQIIVDSAADSVPSLQSSTLGIKRKRQGKQYRILVYHCC